MYASDGSSKNQLRVGFSFENLKEACLNLYKNKKLNQDELAELERDVFGYFIRKGISSFNPSLPPVQPMLARAITELSKVIDFLDKDCAPEVPIAFIEQKYDGERLMVDLEYLTYSCTGLVRL